MGFLEPAVAEFFQRAANVQGFAQSVGAAGRVVQQIDVETDVIADGTRPRDIGVGGAGPVVFERHKARCERLICAFYGGVETAGGEVVIGPAARTRPAD